MPRDTPYAGVASIFRSDYEAGKAPEVFEDGGQARVFIHVCDTARCSVLALTNADPSHGAFNGCTGNPKTVLDRAVALRPDVGQHPEVVCGYRLGDIRHVFAIPNRARTDLGFEAKISFEAGTKEFQTAE
jgi:dTDP-L-rhamnose 4-epimerase